MAIAEPLLRELLAVWPVGRLATTDETGAPHVVPIVFCLDGDALYSPIDGKRKSAGRLRRERNVEGQPRFSLLLDEYADDWRRLWWVRLDGLADVYRGGDAHVAGLQTALRSKYPQYADVPVSGADPVFIRLRWHKAVGWSETGLEENLGRAIAASQR